MYGVFCMQVNVPRLTNAMVPANEPWVKLAVGLSRILCGSTPATPPTQITLTLCGGKLKSLGTSGDIAIICF